MEKSTDVITYSPAMEIDDDSTKGVLASVSERSDIFHDILAILQKSYLCNESKQSFRYKSAFLINNNILREQYDNFRERRRVLGYSDEDLKESFGFLLFDDLNKAKQLGDTGVLTGNCTCTTLGDPSKGVYISKYSDCLDLNRWYHGKSGFIAIIRLTKGRVKQVSETYTQNFTTPSVGFDCHESTQLASVSSNTSSFLAFERSQYYMYELLHNESNETSRSPSHACPFAVVSFSYTDSNTFPSEPQLKSEENKTVSYFPWIGKLQISSQIYSVRLKSTTGALLPAKLPEVVKVGRAISMLDLRQLVPKAVFENVFLGEGYLDGIFCSLYELLTLEAEDKSLSVLIQQLKENDLALIIQLNDGGFLILLHSSHFLSYDDTGSSAAEVLQGLFLFPRSRAVQRDTKIGMKKSTIASEILQVLPALMYAESKVEKTFSGQNEKLCDVVVQHIQCYGTLIKPGLATLPPREAGIFPDMYDVPDTLQYIYSAPKWTTRECQNLRLYFNTPVSFQLPMSRVTDLLSTGQEERAEDIDDVYICLSSPESAPDTSVGMMSNDQPRSQQSPAQVGTFVDSCTASVKESIEGTQNISVSEMSNDQPRSQESPAHVGTFVNSCTTSVKEYPESAPDISVSEMSNDRPRSQETPAYFGTFVDSCTASVKESPEGTQNISVSEMSNDQPRSQESPAHVGTFVDSCTACVKESIEGTQNISVSEISNDRPRSQESPAHVGTFVDSCTASVKESPESAPDISVSEMSNDRPRSQETPAYFGTFVDSCTTSVRESPEGAPDISVSEISNDRPRSQETPAYVGTFVDSVTASVKESLEGAPDISVSEISNDRPGSQETPAYVGTFVDSVTASVKESPEGAPDNSVSEISNDRPRSQESPAYVGTFVDSCTASVKESPEGAPDISVSEMSNDRPISQETPAHVGTFVNSVTASVKEQYDLTSILQNEMSVMTEGTSKEIGKPSLAGLTKFDNIPKIKSLWIAQTSSELPTELILSIASAEGSSPVPDQSPNMICALSASKHIGTLSSSLTDKSEVVGAKSMNNNVDTLLDCPKDSNPIKIDWRKLPRGRKKGRKGVKKNSKSCGQISGIPRPKLTVAAGNLIPKEQAKARELSDFSKANNSSRTEIKSMKPAIGKHNIIEQYGLGNIPIRKITERWYLQPVITECGRILVPHGSIDKDDLTNSLKDHPKVTDRKQSPDKVMVEAVQPMSMEQETSTALEKMIEKKNNTPIVQSDSLQNVDLHHEHSQNQEFTVHCVSKLITSEANNKNDCNETIAKADMLPDKVKETKNSELLFSRLKTVILNVKRKPFNLVSAMTVDNAQDGEPFIKKKKSDSFMESLMSDSNKCPLDKELATEEVSKPVDPHFAHALRLTPKNITNKEQKTQNLGKEQETLNLMSELRDSSNSQDQAMAQTISVSVSDKLEPLIRPLTPAPGKSGFKTSQKKPNKPTEYIRKKWWLHFHAPAYFAKDRRKYNICTGINSAKKNVKENLQSTTDALTLLADLALCVSNDKTSQQPETALERVPELGKCDLTKDGPSSERESVLHALLKQPPTMPALPPKSPLPKALSAIKDMVHLISKEHAYSFSPSSSLLLGLSVLPFQVPSSCDSAGQHHQNISSDEILALCLKSKREVQAELQQKKFRDFRTIVEKDGSIKVTRQWKEDYDFALDSRFANDSMDKTVARALHGPWDFNIRDTSEEVLFIVHMWIGLFYSRSTGRLFHIDPRHTYSETIDCMEMSGMTPELTQAAIKTSSPTLVPSLTSATKVMDLSKKRTPALNQGSLVLDLSLRKPNVEDVPSNHDVRTISESHKLSGTIGHSPDPKPLHGLHEENMACLLQLNDPRCQTFRNQVELDELDVEEDNECYITNISESESLSTHEDGNLKHCAPKCEILNILCKEMAYVSIQQENVLETKGLVLSPGPSINNVERGDSSKSNVKAEVRVVAQHTVIDNSPKTIPAVDLNCECTPIIHQDEEEENESKDEHHQKNGKALDEVTVSTQDQTLTLFGQSHMELGNNESSEMEKIESTDKVHIEKPALPAYEDSDTLFFYQDTKGERQNEVALSSVKDQKYSQELSQNTVFHQKAQSSESENSNKWEDQTEQLLVRQSHLNQNIVVCPKKLYAQIEIPFIEIQASCQDTLYPQVPHLQNIAERVETRYENETSVTKDINPMLDEKVISVDDADFFEQMASSNSILHDRCPTPTIDEKPYSYTPCSEPCSSATIVSTDKGCKSLSRKDVNKASMPRSDELPLEKNIYPLSSCNITTLLNKDESTFSLNAESQPRTPLQTPHHQQSNRTNELMNKLLGPGVCKNSHPISLSSHAVHPSLDHDGQEGALYYNSDDKVLSHSMRPVMAVKPSKCNGNLEDCIYKEGKITSANSNISGNKTDKGPVVTHTTQTGTLVEKPMEHSKCRSDHGRNKNYHKYYLVGKGGQTNKESIEVDEAQSASNLMFGCNRERARDDEKVTLRAQSTSSFMCTVFNSGKNVANISVDELSQRCLNSNPTQVSIEQDFLIFLQQMKRLVNRSKRGPRIEQTNIDDSATFSCPSPMTVNFSRLQEHEDSLDNLEELPSLDGQKIKIEVPERRCLSGTTDGVNMLHLRQLSCDNGDAAAHVLVSDMVSECTSSYQAMMNDACEGKKNVTQSKGFKIDRRFSKPDHLGRIFTGQMNTEMYENLQSNLNLVVRQSCKTKYSFYILVTSDESFFGETKALLKAEGHTEVQPSQFFLAENISSLVIILKNEDIAEHICEVPNLLELKKSAAVLFAGIDLPDDIMNLTHQELFSSGGFIVFERATLQALSVCNLKTFLEVLEEQRKKAKWQWLLHYKDSRYLKENLWLSAEVKEKKFLIERCQETGIAEVLPYHECDLMTTNPPNYLTCLVHLQIQKISARFAVFITDSTPDTRFGRNGILAMNMNSFLILFQS